jgi:hypothetical protein
LRFSRELTALLHLPDRRAPEADDPLHLGDAEQPITVEMRGQ